MRNKYTLNDAKNFVGKLENTVSLEGINYVQFGKALKILANRNDTNNFKRITDRYFSLANSCGNEALIKDSYSFLEGICIGMDNLYKNGYVELRKKKMKEGKATKLLKKLYSQKERK